MKTFFLLIVLFCSTTLFGQDIASWNVTVATTGTGEAAEKYLVFSARLDASWNVYGSNFTAPIGPLPTAVELTPDASYEPVGKLECEKPEEAIDPSWSIAYTYFSGQAEFRQRVKVKNGRTHIRGVIKGQYLNKKNHHLQDFEEPFDLFVP